MKKIILNLLILIILSSNSNGATTIKPNFDSIISVEIIKEDKNNEEYYFKKLKEERNLEKRMRILELAVIQLQERVFGLNEKNHQLQTQLDKREKKEFSFYITTPFNGTHIGTASTKAEAKGIALQKCQESGASSVWCNESNLKSD